MSYYDKFIRQRTKDKDIETIQNNLQRFFKLISDAIEELEGAVVTIEAKIDLLLLNNEIIYTKTVSQPSNLATDYVLATVYGGDVYITDVTVTSISAQPADFTSIAVYGGTADAVEFQNSSEGNTYYLSHIDDQIGWNEGWDGSIRLDAGKTIIMRFAGTGPALANFLVVIRYIPASTTSILV